MNTFVQAKIKEGHELRVVYRCDGNVQASIGFDHGVGRNVDSAIANLDEMLERKYATTAARYTPRLDVLVPAAERLRRSLHLYQQYRNGELPLRIDVSLEFADQLGLATQGAFAGVPLFTTGQVDEWRFIDNG